MLSPNAKLSPQTGNWAPNLEFGDTKMKLGTRILGWKQQRPIARTKSEMRNKKLPVPIKSWDWEQFPSIARPISQLRIRKANAVEKHANGRKIVAAGPKNKSEDKHVRFFRKYLTIEGGDFQDHSPTRF